MFLVNRYGFKCKKHIKTMDIKEGDVFPNFSLESDSGTKVSLDNLKGSVSVVYFYPKDDTPGCTKEACSFRDNIDKFNELDIPIYGISVDSPDSHRKFKAKYNLNFPLLSDYEKILVKKLGIKSLSGVAERVTFVLDKDSKILKVYPHVSPDKHSDELLSFLYGLKSK